MSAFAESSGASASALSFIHIFQPTDVAANSQNLFVIHRTCGLPGSQYHQEMAALCPGLTAIYCNSINFQSEILSIDSNGRENTIASLPDPFGCLQKDHLAISPDVGDFPAGYIFVVQGSWGGVNIWKISSDGSSISPFLTNLPPLGQSAYITFDTTGSFSNDMIVSSGSSVWKIDSNGKASQLAEIPVRGHLDNGIGGPAVAPEGFGPYGGDILVPDPTTGNIFAISPQGAVNNIGSWPGASQILFVPYNSCTFGKNNTTFLSSYFSDTGGSIAMYSKEDFSGLAGSALITNQYNPSIGLMTQHNDSITVKQFQSNIDTEFIEGSSFVTC